MTPEEAATAAVYREGAANLRARANSSQRAGDPAQAERDIRQAVLLEGDASRLESGQSQAENAAADARIQRFWAT